MSLAFALRADNPIPTLRFGPDDVPMNLVEKYRPRSLSDVLGQGYIVHSLQSFAAAPHPTAFLFSGPTGVGKTSAALALAHDLGVDRFWGLIHVKAGENNADSIEDVLRQLRLACPAGSGWKLVLVDEADYMSQKAKNLWLSILEDLPPRSIVVFTTNDASKFEQRFIDRCEHFAFSADGRSLRQDGEHLVRSIWRAEDVPGDAPSLNQLGDAINAQGEISFRRIVRTTEAFIRARKAGSHDPVLKAPIPIAPAFQLKVESNRRSSRR